MALLVSNIMPKNRGEVQRNEANRWRKTRAKTKHITQRRSCLPGGDAPAVSGLVLHTRIKGDLIGAGGVQAGGVVDRHLSDGAYRISAGTQLSGESDGITGAEGMDLAEIIAHPSVVVE